MSDIDLELKDQPRRGAPKGNQFWKARSRHGREKIFSSPDAMWEACCEYFQWTEDNPLWEDKAAQYQGGAVDVSVCKMRAMTIEGLCMHFGANSKYLSQFEQSLDLTTQEGKDFSNVISNARDVIRRQKFEGAAADLLNPNIIARDLGLKDVAAHEHTSPDGSMTPKGIDLSNVSTEDLQSLASIAAKLNGAAN